MSLAPDEADAAREAGPSPRRPLVTLAALVVVIWGLRELRTALLPICFGLLLAVLGAPARRWLMRHRVPARVASVTVVAVIVGGGWLLAFALEQTLARFAAVVPTYRARVESLLADLVSALASLGIDADPKLLVSSLEPRTWMTFLGQSLGGAVGLLSAVLLALFILFFALLEVDRIRARLGQQLGASYDEPRLLRLSTALQRYLGVKLATSALTGLCAYAACALFGAPFPALWGLVAFVLNFVPIIGSIVAAVPPVALVLVDPDLSWRIALPLAIVYLAINNLISNLLEPLLMGQQIGISPLAVLLSIVFWGWLWGPGGMFLAVPLTLAVDFLLEHNRDLRFLTALIGRRPG